MTEKIENRHLSVEVNALGAELKSIFNKKNNKEYLWQAHPAFWTRRAPVLFPIVGKVRNNNYQAEGKSFMLGQHGFARDVAFDLLAKDETSLIYETRNSGGTLKVYPYRFSLRIQYQLIENTVAVSYEVLNEDDKTIYFSIGGHPGFNCPLHDNEKLTDYYLEFEKIETAERHLLTDGLFNGETALVLKEEKIINLSETPFEADAVVFKNLRSSFVKLKSRKSDYELTFDFKGFPYLGIWKKPEAPFICIEPWFGLADKVNSSGRLEEKEGILSLIQNEKFSCLYSIGIK